MMSSRVVRRIYEVQGVVQGVGFRPGVHREASRRGLGGSVRNLGDRVELVLEGSPAGIDSFIENLPSSLPRLAQIRRLELIKETVIPEAVSSFRVEESSESEFREIVFPADVATCEHCRSEVLSAEDRRYRYAFTTCTECGPRYTVIDDTPYDRQRTTLRDFPLCESCKLEYSNPNGRRFHAESIACPLCGPTLELRNEKGQVVKGDALRLARSALHDGCILALRGIGGFLLAVDAFSAPSLRLLRERKDRQHKPLAVMMRNLEAVRRYCMLSEEEEELLTSQAAPIVILDRIYGQHPEALPQRLLSPDTDTLGVMLPGSPLQLLIFEPTGADTLPPFEVLVMTSGNKRGEPICISNEEALSRLSGIADFFLLHNREINLRADDSIAVVAQGSTQIWRRAKGYAPGSVVLREPMFRNVLALGAELKNTIALGSGNKVYLSSHIGDLSTPEALSSFDELSESFPRFLAQVPDCIVVDMHPDLYSSRFGEKLSESSGLPLVRVQHHHAHAVSCMAEHGCEESLALVFDGTGYGLDGTIWGGELLWVSPEGFKRLAAFKPSALPGGDAAVLEPVRQYISRCEETNLLPPSWFASFYGLNDEEHAVWAHQSESGLNSPISSAAGRLFDACAAGLGIAPRRISYDAQAAVRLEAFARRAQERRTAIISNFVVSESNDMLWVDWSKLWSSLAQGGSYSESEKAQLACDFHYQVAASALAMVEYAFSVVSSRQVVLSGGVFMNQLLVSILTPALCSIGAQVIVHENIPPNDGGISLGQAVIAGRSLLCV